MFFADGMSQHPSIKQVLQFCLLVAPFLFWLTVAFGAFLSFDISERHTYGHSCGYEPGRVVGDLGPLICDRATINLDYRFIGFAQYLTIISPALGSVVLVSMTPLVLHRFRPKAALILASILLLLTVSMLIWGLSEFSSDALY